jgi:hypothetical protein
MSQHCYDLVLPLHAPFGLLLSLALTVVKILGSIGAGCETLYRFHMSHCQGIGEGTSVPNVAIASGAGV